jgi:ABC-type multidrug transport system ATPase subunit
VEGRAVACTIHQPSSRLYTHLDRLMLLAEGQLLYSGAAGAVVDWFGGFGLRVPFGTSIAGAGVRRAQPPSEPFEGTG